ncbi:type II secretion system F family protein [Saccharopolyspora phatthalungensis]|uniref:Flp pilus assembly protein TadB n=1 Tax=Saccharopolyspora phatthalungensis TaxID=664693 RepID=A0A840QG39_9PSEU|nr:Flp pilus assembly protein TadB [Saccharopolyspora phatthalungensis]
MTPAINTTTVVAAVLGLGIGVGLLLVISGWRGVPAHRPRRFARWHRGNRNQQRLLLRVTGVLTVGLLAGVVTGWVVGALLAGLACWALPRVLGRDPEHARRIARIEAIATWTEMLRDTLASAAGLEQAILATAPLSPTAIRPEITELAARLENGERLAPSLRVLADQLADPTGDLVIASLVLASEQRARQLGELLGSLAKAARDQASMRMRVEAGRARTRTSVRVIVGTTCAFAVGIVLLNRSYLAAYDSPTGQLMLLAVGGLFALGFAWLARIATVSEPTRFLAAAAPGIAGGQGEDVSGRQVSP